MVAFIKSCSDLGWDLIRVPPSLRLRAVRDVSCLDLFEVFFAHVLAPERNYQNVWRLGGEAGVAVSPHVHEVLAISHSIRAHVLQYACLRV